jgi:four helix bundle protein
MMTGGSHENLIVWQKSVDLCVEIYALTKRFPSEEKYGITSQIRRAAVSIPSNIAEGRRRGGDKEFCRYLRISFGSGAELETQLLIASRLGYILEKEYAIAKLSLNEVMKLLNKLISTTS